MLQTYGIATMSVNVREFGLVRRNKKPLPTKLSIQLDIFF